MNLFKIIWPDKTEQELAYEGDLASLINTHWGSTPVPETVEIHQMVGEYVQQEIPKPVIDQAPTVEEQAAIDAQAAADAAAVVAAEAELAATQKAEGGPSAANTQQGDGNEGK